MVYTKEDYDIDCDWLIAQGLEGCEAANFIADIIKKSGGNFT